MVAQDLVVGSENSFFLFHIDFCFFFQTRRQSFTFSNLRHGIYCIVVSLFEHLKFFLPILVLFLELIFGFEVFFTARFSMIEHTMACSLVVLPSFYRVFFWFIAQIDPDDDRCRYIELDQSCARHRLISLPKSSDHSNSIRSISFPFSFCFDLSKIIITRFVGPISFCWFTNPNSGIGVQINLWVIW